MFEDIYLVDGKYPDPHSVENKLDELKNSGDDEEYKKAVTELRKAGMGSHPLLGRFFVES